MQRLKEVDEAKAVMMEALEWSVMKWLREKKTVRKMADRANAALDKVSAATKANWGKDLQLAYDQLTSDDSKPRLSKHDAGTTSLAKLVKSADDVAREARAEAEKTFDDAEKQLSTSLAREGCRKAIASWNLHQKAIDLAQKGLASSKK